MKFEIRPAVKEEMEDFKHVAFTALAMSPEVMPPEIVHGINPDWTLCAFEMDEPTILDKAFCAGGVFAA